MFHLSAFHPTLSDGRNRWGKYKGKKLPVHPSPLFRGVKLNTEKYRFFPRWSSVGRSGAGGAAALPDGTMFPV